jgi:diguanylate cyclase (GGDEF)-like protein/PAS domain S-box-containing protein
VFLLAASIAAGLLAQIERNRLEHERTLVSGYAKDHARHLKVYIERALSATYALAALVRIGQGRIPNFDQLAEEMLPLYPGASELVLASGGKIQNVAPLRGNEKAIGLDLLRDPAQKAEASISRNSGRLTLAGPFNLVQGGLGVAGRLPVFLTDDHGNSVFWGFTEVVMRLPEALIPAQLSHLATQGYNYELWRIHPGTGRKQIIEASSSAALIDPVEQTVEVPNGLWTLSVAPVKGWGDPLGLSLRAGFGLSLSVLLAYLAKLLTDLKARGQKLEALVAQRTASIVAAKDHLKAILDAIPDPVWLKSSNGVFLSCNRQFERYFGAAEAEILGRTDYDFVASELADFFRENDRNAMLSDQPHVNEEWLTFAASGYRGLFETIKTAMRDSSGNVTGVLGIARDITARKRAEKAARLSKTRLSVTLEATQIAIWDWEIKRDRWRVSRSYFTNLGYAPESGQPDREVWLSRVHPDDLARVRLAIDTVLTGGSTAYEYDARLRHSDGTYRWMSVRGKVVERDNDGRATRMLGVRMDITGHKEAEERIQRLAHFDALTGLPNRTLLNDRVAFAIGMAQRKHESLAVLVIDIDNFKTINDTFGHRVGDNLLLAFAKRIKSHAREDDTVARIGGDEFVVVMPSTDADRAAHVARQLLESLSDPYEIEQLELVATPTIGIALYPSDGQDFDLLLKCADTAMHRAKNDGRNHFVFFTVEMQVSSVRKLLLENALRRALERAELHLHYQPQVSLTNGHLTGVEALLRWSHPDLGAVSPAEFIPIAEDSGLILPIGEWVLRSAVAQLKTWLDGGLAPMTMAVNLSSVQFRHPNLPELIRRILEEAHLPGRYLELELTERVAMGDPLGAIAVMGDLHRLEVRMSIDDFGTGYSSLNYLKRFRTYKLKIDQSFIGGVTEDPDDRSIVSAVISLARSLGLQTIAEGVETAGQLAFLKAEGCTEAQGYYFSKPLPADEFQALAQDTNRHATWAT